MHCQRVCPENKKVVDWIEEGTEFSSEETEMLVGAESLGHLDSKTAHKLEQWDLARMADILPRNLDALTKIESS